MSGVAQKQLNSQQIRLVAVCTVCLLLSTTVIALRLLARRASGVKFWWDDHVAILALMVSWIPNVATVTGISHGLGRHVADVDPSKVVAFGISFWVHELGWTLSIGVTIASILLFYVRLFPQKWMRWMRWSLFGLSFVTAGWTISIFLAMVFQCRPVDYALDARLPNGKCINANAMYFSSAVISGLTILAVLLLPLPVVYKLQTSKSKKIGLAFSFSAGIFVLVVSIVRLTVLLGIDRQDLTYTTVMPQLWSCVEASFGIISACIPSLTPLYHIARGKQSWGRRQSGETSSPGNSRRRSSGSRRKSKVPDFDQMGAIEHGVESPHRVSMFGQNPRRKTPEDELFEEIENKYPGIVVTHRIDQEVASRSDLTTEDTLESRQIPESSSSTSI